jgi:hypothetical protein
MATISHHFKGPPMHTQTPATPASIIDDSAKQLASLRGDHTNQADVAAHIRGMVAATMAHLSAQGNTASGDQALQWQQWALGVADGLAVPLAG